MIITTENNGTIKLTHEDIRQILRKVFVKGYMEWAYARYEEEHPKKIITKDIKDKFKKIAHETFEEFMIDDLISNREYEMFTDKYTDYIKE